MLGGYMFTQNKKLSIIGIITSISLAGCGGGGGSAASLVSALPDIQSSTTNYSNLNATIVKTEATVAGVDTAIKPNAAANINENSNNNVASPSIKEWVAPAISDYTTKAKIPLIINEISSQQSKNQWIEIYNPNSENVNISEHKLRSFSTTNTVSSGTQSDIAEIFDLPNAIIPAKSYIIIAPKTNIWMKNGADVFFINKADKVPMWSKNGFIELIYDGKTMDMVNISKYYAASDSSYKPRINNTITIDSIYKNYAIWNGSWQTMNFATPSGLNDIEPTAIDQDGDGIPSSAKQPGKTFGGIDIYSMGARVGQKDIFIQHDYMNGLVSIPAKQALDKVKQAFALKNIALHMDVGALYSNKFDPENYNLGDGKMFAMNNCTILPNYYDSSSVLEVGCNSLFDYKQNMSGMRRSFFHYSLWANAQQNSSKGPSGIAEYLGKNILISLSGWGLSNETPEQKNLLANYQAGAFMHELGHNFGLLHGGDENMTYKPNYNSVMNYLYQLKGVTKDISTSWSIDRFFVSKGSKGLSICTLNNSPCKADFVLDYSSGKMASIDENQVSENNDLNGYNANSNGHYLDWNNDSINNSSLYAQDINRDAKNSVLHDYNDWLNLKFAANKEGSGQNSMGSALLMGVMHTVDESH
jgi:Lamin Tail Domain